MNGKVFSVDHVTLRFGFSDPPTIFVFAKGKVPTLGWSNGHLVPYIYITPPEDGIWDFDFVAKAPSGIVPQVISPIISKPFITLAPDWFKGVRIHASTNKLETAGGDVASGEGVSYTRFDFPQRGGVDLLPWATNEDNEMSTEGGHDTLPWAALLDGGVVVLPWRTTEGGGDAFPWKVASSEVSS